MNTISIDSDVYKGVEIYAQLLGINVKDFIEKAIISAVGKNKPTTGTIPLKSESELSPQVRSLIGNAAETDADDLDGRNERLEYLMEKQ